MSTTNYLKLPEPIKLIESAFIEKVKGLGNFYCIVPGGVLVFGRCYENIAVYDVDKLPEEFLNIVQSSMTTDPGFARAIQEEVPEVTQVCISY